MGRALLVYVQPTCSQSHKPLLASCSEFQMSNLGCDDKEKKLEGERYRIISSKAKFGCHSQWYLFVFCSAEVLYNIQCSARGGVLLIMYVK